MKVKRRYVVLGVVAAVSIFVGVQVYSIFHGPNVFEGVDAQTVYVSKGRSFASIVDSLEAKGIIRSRPLFVFVSRILGGANKIKVGKYEVRSGISNAELFLRLREGVMGSVIPVTLPEGLRARTQARIFARSLGLDSSRFMDIVTDEQFVHSLGIKSKSLEGYLLPETYHFTWQPDERDVIERLVKEFHTFYTDSLKARARDLGWTTNQVITFASIVEGEAVLDSERGTIAGVYHNRLRKRMRLEADPTIQFILEDGPRRVLYSDLKVDDPYNTYRYHGLPPGPVNNPGKASILAALFPEEHKYLFFVANGKGAHWFSTNYTDHLRHVRQYRRERSRQVSSITRSSTGEEKQ